MTANQPDPASLSPPPGPDGLPVLGSTLSLMRGPFDFLDGLRPYGDVVQYRTAFGTFTALLHPDHVERVLLNDSDRFEQVDVTSFDIGIDPEGLVDVRGEQWRRQRTVMQPAFTMDRIQSYADAMVGVTAETVESWDDGDTIAVDEAFSELTLQILTRSLFDIGVESDDAAVIARITELLNEQFDVTNPSVYIPSWVPTPSNRRFERAYDEFVDRVDAMIAARRESDDPGDDLLSILLHAETDEGATLSETEVRDNMLTFLFAGHETTALGLAYAVFLLAQHDDELERLRAEHEAVIGADDPTFEHVPQLTATRNVVDETLRLYPPIPVLFRTVSEPTAFGDYRVDAGTTLTVPQFALHRDDRFWDDPMAFEPDRWNESREDDRPKYAYFPFGGGPRHCIGMRFARLELQLVLAVLCRQFDFELVSDSSLEFDQGVTLRPAESIEVRLHER